MAEFDPEPPPLVLPPAPPVLSPTIPLNPPMVGEASPWIHVDGENRDLILESIRAWIRQTLLPWTSRWQTQLTDWEGDAATQLNEWLTLADTYITGHAIAGLSFRTTATPIAGAGNTNVALVVDTDLRPIALGDLVLDQAPDGNYGIITVIIDDTHATVNYVGSLLGPQGIQGLSWRTTVTDIAGAGTTNVVLAAPFVIGDLVITTNIDGNWGTITALVDPTHATVTYAGSLRGPQGAAGSGTVASIVAGTGIAVDDTDPENPVVSATGGGGGSAITYGYYADRPIIGGTAPGTIYIATDTGESYIATTGHWVEYGGGSELAYAQVEDSSLVTATNSTDVPIPGLITTFVAGEAPVMVHYLVRISAGNADSVNRLGVLLGHGSGVPGPIAYTEFAAVAPASVWHTFEASCRLFGLQPGDTYTVIIAIALESGTGPAYFAADIPTPTFVQVIGH